MYSIAVHLKGRQVASKRNMIVLRRSRDVCYTMPFKSNLPTSITSRLLLAVQQAPGVAVSHQGIFPGWSPPDNKKNDLAFLSLDEEIASIFLVPGPSMLPRSLK